MKNERIAQITSRLGQVQGRLKAEHRISNKDFDLEIDQLEEAIDKLVKEVEAE